MQHAPAGTEITNNASIVFDTNAPLVTNTVANTVRDALADLAITSAGVTAGEGAVLEGATASVSATVTNSGEVAAPALDVRVFDGDPATGGLLVGTAQLVSGLAVGATATVSIPWLPARVQGNRPLFVVADRANTIPEADEANNTLQLTATVGARAYTVHLAPGVNLLAPPLEDAQPWTASRLAETTGATLVVGLDAQQHFTAFTPADPDHGAMGTDFVVDQAHGCLVMLPGTAPRAVTFTGITHLAQLSVQKDLNLLALPLDPGQVTTASALSQTLGATQLLRFDTGDQAFTPFIPGFTPPDGDFALDGGTAYLAVAAQATTATFPGTGWNGEGPQAELPHGPSPGERAAAFGIVGGVTLQTEWSMIQPATEPVTLHIVDERTGATTRTWSQEGSGEYGAALVDLTNAKGVRAGDVLQLLVRDTDGRPLGDTLRYVVTESDVKRGHARVDAQARLLPRTTAFHLPGPEPFVHAVSLRYQLAQPGAVTLRIYDVAGRAVRTLVAQDQTPGYYERRWEGTNEHGWKMTSGVYFVRLEAPGYTMSRRVTLIR